MAKIAAPDRFTKLPERYRRRAREISQRVAEIDAVLCPSTPDQVGDSLIRMRRHFRPQPDTEEADMAAGFKDACRDIPAWAVSEAANDFLAGRVPNHTGQFMPTCAEFARRAREVMTPFLAERASLRTEAENLVQRAEDEARRLIIEIERQSPAVKARVAGMVAGFRVGKPTATPMKRLGIAPEKQARLDAMKRLPAEQSRIGYREGGDE